MVDSLYSINGLNKWIMPVTNPIFGEQNNNDVFSMWKDPMKMTEYDDFMMMFNNFNSFLFNPSIFKFTNSFNTETNLPQLQKVYNKKASSALANIAYNHAAAKNTRHKCLQGARESLNKSDLVDGYMGASAYQAADVLSKNKNFKEVKVDRKDLKSLPAGCIIVWDRNYVGTSSADVHGHIAITLGNGREASDHVSDKIYMLNSSHRVFVPVV